MPAAGLARCAWCDGDCDDALCVSCQRTFDERDAV